MNNGLTGIHLIGTDAELQKTANLRLIQLMAYAPPGARAIGRMEKVGKSYLATVEVKSSFRTFVANGLGNTEEGAVKRVLEKLEDQLFQWRFGRGPNVLARSRRPDVLSRPPLVRSG